MSETQKFQVIVRGIREDLTYVERLYSALNWNLTMNPYLNDDFHYTKTAFEIREWIFDVFLDKIYEIDAKVQKFLTDLSSDAEEMHKKFSIQEIEKYVREIIHEKQGLGHGKTFENLNNLKLAIANYRYALDVMFDGIRKIMHEKNWTPMKKISLEDYVLMTKRRKYIDARQNLENAKQAVKNGKEEDILTNLRSAIELAVKERFGFTKFKTFGRFLEFADKNDFPLPSYDMLYFFYNEGSGRLHAGRLHTPLEYQSALEFVDSFIDNLELVTISQEEIENFKKKCDSVE
jgi:hypothetical protein